MAKRSDSNLKKGIGSDDLLALIDPAAAELRKVVSTAIEGMIPYSSAYSGRRGPIHGSLMALRDTINALADADRDLRDPFRADLTIGPVERMEMYERPITIAEIFAEIDRQYPTL